MSADANHEMARLLALRSYQLLDTPPNSALDTITQLAARLLGMPIALVDLVDAERIWSKSHFGTNVTEYQLHPGLCASAILGDAPYIVNDAKTDPRTAQHPLIQHNGVGFYAGIPLKTPENYNIGTLCVIDFAPRTLSPADIQALQDLAYLAMETIILYAKAQRQHEIAAIENKFRLNELQNQLILNSTVEGIHVIDLNGIVIVENLAAVNMLGREVGDLVGRHAHDTLHHHHADHSPYPVADCPIYKTLHDGQPRSISNEVFWRKDGTSFPVEYSTSPLRDLDGKLCGTTVVFRDITARKINESRIKYLAYYDALTGLPNRTLFIDRLEQEIKKAHRNQTHLSLMFIDLDRFKEINDTLGHDVGDQLLVEAAKRLSVCVRDSDTVARLGGDEFTIITAGLTELGAEELIVQKVLAALSAPFTLNNETVYVSASIGITVYPEDAVTTEELLKKADQSMYAAKKAGRNRYHYYTSAMQEHANSHLRLITDLHHAIEHQEFFLVYQPIVHLATGVVNKAEALIRWQHPSKGLISPLEFIAVAEEVGLIVEIGQWVFEESVRQIQALLQANRPHFQISVNKSPVQFNAQTECSNSWVHTLQALGLSGQNICVEITEGLLLDPSKSTKAKLYDFKAAGMQVSLDDFGTGYSSLSYLNQFSIDFIKIDRSFVCDLAINSANYALCEAIIAMAHKLNIQVIAEGIETQCQLQLLMQAGCDYGQGYYLAKPMSKQAFEHYLCNQVPTHVSIPQVGA